MQFAQEQCLQQYIEEPARKNDILDVFLTINDQLTRQIIITETSMSDHNIIQVETNRKIVEEKQNHQIKKSNLSYRDLNFFNEDTSWASIDAHLLSTSWDMLLTDVKTDEMYKIITNVCLVIYKKHVLPKKSPRKHQIPRDRRALMRQKGFVDRCQQIIKPKKMYYTRSKKLKTT